MLARLPDAAGEQWALDESPCVESDATWRTTVANTPALDRLIARQASGRRRSGASTSASASGAGAGGGVRRADSSALRHIMAASDPVNAVAGGSDWRADTALREFANRTRSVSESAVSGALQDDPLSERGEAAFREVCAALGVGLIVQGEGFRVVKLCEEKNVWLARTGAGAGAGAWDTVPWCRAPVGARAARALMADKGRACAAEPTTTSMRELRAVAESCGLPRPLPRSKQALCELIARELAA